jgi:chlorophyllide a reductase subunit X
VPPDLIVGHGVLGRLLARMTWPLGLAAATVWETNPSVAGRHRLPVLHPDDDPRRDYHAIYDVSGDVRILDRLIARLAPGGEVVLAGFYSRAAVSFNFAPAFMREAQIRVAAEWKRADLLAVRELAESRPLSLDGLITHHAERCTPSAPTAPPSATTSLPEDGPRLENRTNEHSAPDRPVIFMQDERLKAEAAIEPDPCPPAPAAKTTQIIAIYGKGGIGKSFTLANLSYMMAQQGKKVLLIGCDPKSDTTSLLFGGKACPTIIETSSKKKLAGEAVAIGDVCFKRDGVYAMELGGPEVGRGCGGRGIIHGFETLEKLGFHDWGFDYVLLDFLGDVVCGGFGLPIARDMCQKVIVVASNDLQSLYVANNVCSAVEYFRKLGGNVGVAGMVINKDDGTGEAQAFAANAGIPVLATIPANEDIRRKSASYEIIGRPGTQWAPLFEELATNVGRGAAGAAQAADAGPVAGPVLGRGDRARLQDGAGHAVRHGGQERDRQAHARSHLRRGLTMDRAYISDPAESAG